MSTSNVTLSYGTVAFSAEGAEDWVSAQFDKILEAAAKLSEVPLAPKGEPKLAPTDTGSSGPFTATLAGHIKTKNGEVNQVRRFLATADWLRLRKSEKLNTSAVAKALSDNHQKKLGNPSDCLNKNVTKGHCEKLGDDFFITPDGLKELGYV
jgi:hypothetical protein